MSSIVMEVYAAAKILHLCMRIYNLGTAGIIFSHKIGCLASSIFGFYFLIRLMFTQPAATCLVFFLFAFNSMAFYTIMWENSSLIPVMFGLLRAETDVVASAQLKDRAYLKRVSRSIPNIGVQVGGFRIIERDSSLIFVDFVLNNVVSLLIM